MKADSAVVTKIGLSNGACLPRALIESILDKEITLTTSPVTIGAFNWFI